MNYVPLSPYELAALATFNAEVARGILHSEDWRRQMAALQARYDATLSAPRPER